MATPSPLFGINLLTLDQANAETAANTLFLALEQAGALQFITFKRLTNPSALSPSDGDAHVLSGTGAGDWAGYAENDIAFYYQGWVKITPHDGLVGINHDTGGSSAQDALQGAVMFSGSTETAGLAWHSLNAPLWAASGVEYFTGRYSPGGLKIYAKAFYKVLTGGTSTQAHSVTLHASEFYAGVRDAVIYDTDASPVEYWTVPDSDSSIKVDGTNVTITTTLSSPTNYTCRFVLDYVKA